MKIRAEKAHQFFYKITNYSTFYLVVSTILLSYIIPIFPTLTNIQSFFPKLWESLHSGSLLLTTLTISSTMLYDTWGKVQRRIALESANFEYIKDEPNTFLNFILLMFLIFTTVLYSMTKIGTFEISDSFVIFEIIIFCCAILFHARITWIDKNTDKYARNLENSYQKYIQLELEKNENISGESMESSESNESHGYNA